MDFSPYAYTIMKNRYAHHLSNSTPKNEVKENWADVAKRVSETVFKTVDVLQSYIDKMTKFIEQRKIMPGGRYLAATGRPFHQVQNCVLLRPEDTREGWGEHSRKVVMASMTGAGLGAVYSDLRNKRQIIKRTGGISSGPCALMIGTNELGRMSKQGGDRRAALWAGLHWNHPDVFEFIALKQWDEHTKKMKEQDFSYPAPMDHTNISVIIDDDFFIALEAPNFMGKLRFQDEEINLHDWAQKLFQQVVRQMLETGEPGWSIDLGNNKFENLRNACTEITSEDDSDICNLASINLANVESEQEMAELVEVATMFLLAGTVYSDIPYPKIDEIRKKNRRLGLGLMGMHEWLLKRGKPYGPDADLEKYLKIYTTSTVISHYWADRWNLSKPLKTRAIAPTGTIGIVAETTTGIEPIFCAAYKRRYLKGETWRYQWVLDPTAKRLVAQGVNPNTIEDAYSISAERRLEFQAWAQQYVDHAISSTINLPAWGSEQNNEAGVEAFSNLLLRFLPKIRGVTCYPDGSRGGQPLTPAKYNDVAHLEGMDFEEGNDTGVKTEIITEALNVCSITGGGQCGS